MTNIAVETTSYFTDDRSWLISQWGQNPGENPSITIDVSAFTSGTHYPNGFIASGEPLGKITATSSGDKIVVGPYDNAAVDGREVCIGFLHSAVKVPSLTDSTKDTNGALVKCGFIKEARLPRAIDATGKTDLKLCDFS